MTNATSTESTLQLSGMQSTDKGKKSLRSYPTIVHVAVLSAFVLPIAFLPYWAARRQILTLRQRVERLEIGANLLRKEIYITSSAQTWTKDELRRIQSTIQDAVKESHDWQAHLDRREANRIASDQKVQTELRRLLQEAHNTQAAALSGIGMSLADIAAFIEEIELDFGMENQGKDRRRVERIRSLALNLSQIK